MTSAGYSDGLVTLPTPFIPRMAAEGLERSLRSEEAKTNRDRSWLGGELSGEACWREVSIARPCRPEHRSS